MLVVSRKENQSVVFPNLGISVEITRVAGKTVRVGIEAPEEVRILRGELHRGSAADEVSGLLPGAATAKEKHELRNRLNKAGLALRLLQKQLANAMVSEAEASLEIALEAFRQVEQSVSAQGTQTAQPPSPCFADRPTDNAPRRKRALLVEDDPNERMLLASYLRASGYEVDTAEDGKAALEYLNQHKPDAVVMDMEMPRMNGCETVREIRSDYHFDDMKLYVVSGMERESMPVPTGDRGIQRWFQKPLSPEDLVNELACSLN